MRTHYKKLLTLLMSVTLCAGLFLPLFSGSSAAAGMPGDVDGDGKLTPADARLTLRASVKLENYQPGSPEFLAADLDGDGVIRSSEARLILRAAVGLETLGNGGSSSKLKADAMNAYRAEVKRVLKANEGARNEDTIQFILYDMDLNGIPELILDNGYKTLTTADGFSVYTYTAEQGLIHLGNMKSHGYLLFDLTPGDNEISLLFAYHSYVGEFDYRVENNVLVETVVSDTHPDTFATGISDAYQREKEIADYIIVKDTGWTPAQKADQYFDSLT